MILLCTTGLTSGAGITYTSGALDFTPSFCGVRVTTSFVFCVVFCTLLFVLRSFFVVHCIDLSFDGAKLVLWAQLMWRNIISQTMFNIYFDIDHRYLWEWSKNIFPWNKFFKPVKFINHNKEDVVPNFVLEWIQ